MTTEEREAKAALRARVVKFATGMPAKDAYALLEQVRDFWGIPSYAKLARLVESMPEAMLSPAALVFWLDTTRRVMHSPNGREVIFAAAVRIAKACGVTAELFDVLREHVIPPTTPTTDETRH
jgi:hypothetical protein